MAITTRERTELRDELVGQGYSWEYIDDWHPKITLYRHAIKMSPSGEVISPAGTAVKGLPGNPDYVARKAKLGMLPYLPSDTCTCRWCAESRIEVKKDVVSSTDENNEPFATAECSDCSFKATAPTGTGAASRLRAHSKIHS